MSDETAADVASKLVDKLSNGADRLAQAVGKVAPHAWETAVRAQRTDALVTLVGVGIVLSIIAFAAYRLIGPYWTAVTPARRGYNDQDEPDEEARLIARWLSGAVVLLCIGISAWNVPDAIRGLCNPEYYAALALLAAVK